MIPFTSENDALNFADRFACGPFSILLTSVAGAAVLTRWVAPGAILTIETINKERTN